MKNFRNIKRAAPLFNCYSKAFNLSLFSSSSIAFNSSKFSTSKTFRKELLTQSFGNYLVSQVQKYENKDIFTSPDEDEVKWTWLEVQASIRATAQGYYLNGSCKKGDTIPYFMESGTHNFVGLLANAEAETIFVPIPPCADEEKIKFVLKKINPRNFYLQPKYKEKDNIAIMDNLIKELPYWPLDTASLKLKKFPNLKLIGVTGIKRFAGGYTLFRDILCKEIRPDPVPVPNKISPDSIFSYIINFSNGKVSAFTQNAVLNNAYFLADAIGLKSTDRMCLITPLYSHVGIVSGAVASITAGSVVNLCVKAHNEDRIVKGIERDYSSILNCSDKDIFDLLKHPNLSKYNLSTLKKFIIARNLTLNNQYEDLPLAQIFEKFPIEEIIIIYSSNEAGVFAYNKITRNNIDKSNLKESYLLDQLKGKVNKNSELLVNGYSVMKEYLNDSEATKAVKTADGWVNTGIVAKIDASSKITFK